MQKNKAIVGVCWAGMKFCSLQNFIHAEHTPTIALFFCTCFCFCFVLFYLIHVFVLFLLIRPVCRDLYTTCAHMLIVRS